MWGDRLIDSRTKISIIRSGTRAHAFFSSSGPSPTTSSGHPIYIYISIYIYIYLGSSNKVPGFLNVFIVLSNSVRARHSRGGSSYLIYRTAAVDILSSSAIRAVYCWQRHAPSFICPYFFRPVFIVTTTLHPTAPPPTPTRELSKPLPLAGIFGYIKIYIYIYIFRQIVKTHANNIWNDSREYRPYIYIYMFIIL